MTDDLLTRFRARLRAGETSKLFHDLDTFLNGQLERRGGHVEWGLLCEETGLLNLAFREFQLALRDDPDDAVAAFHLAQHYRERGNAGRALDLLERLLRKEPARREWLELFVEVSAEDGGIPRAREAIRRARQAGLPADVAAALTQALPTEDEPPPPDGEFTVTDADCGRMASLFAGRENVHARQWSRPDGQTGYTPVHEPITPAVIRNHLLGTFTAGVYPIRLDGTCTFFAVDLDIDRAALEQAHGQPAVARRLRADLAEHGLRLLGVLREFGLEVIFEDSGFKGRHYWAFLAEPENAAVLNHLGRLFLAWQSPLLPRGLHLEFFPKQGKVEGKGLGNLIKLPLGIHRRTGRRALLLDGNGQPLSQPIARLRQVARVPRASLYAVIEKLKAHAAAAPPAASPTGEPAVPARPRRADGPLPPGPGPAWTEADFEADPRMRHLLAGCPVLAELKRMAEEQRQLTHEEQLVVIHTLGHLDGGPQAVNYLLDRCVDVGKERHLKSALRGNPVSCPSIRKKIGHVTRRVNCNCSFDFAPNRYPTPVLHLLTLREEQRQEPAPAARADPAALAVRYGVLLRRRDELEREVTELRNALLQALRASPDGTAECPGGRYRLVEADGVAELRWEPAEPDAEPTPPAAEANPSSS